MDGQDAARPPELAQRVDLPRQVVEPDGGARPPRLSGAGADLERAEVVVVVRAGAWRNRPGNGNQLAEAEGLLVELTAPLDVAHVEHRMVQPLHTHAYEP